MRTRKKQPQIYVLGSLFALITLVLWARLIHVQIISHSEYKSKARAQWTRTREIPAIRGGIFDRYGRPLALSTYSYSVYVDPTSVTDPKRVVSLLSEIPGVSRKAVRNKLRSESTFEWIKRRFQLTEAFKDSLQKLQGVGIHIVADRVYPWGSVANKIIGFIGHDNRGMAGIEAACDDILAGTPGWEKIVLDGKYRAHGYYNFPQKLPENGKQIILTIDAVIQEIAETELERAVGKTKARWGSVIILNNKTGEILALAEYPSARSRTFINGQESLWTIQSLSCVIEPGSTFKLVTSAALLEKGLVTPSERFDAERGRADLGFAVISDAHPHGVITFREGFVESSNIVMAKAAMRLSRVEFYKFIRLFGFGVLTGVGLLGESGGTVAPVEDWSDRTQATMAFGQEIAVTPLQMANAFAAVANNGAFMDPYIVKAIIDEDAEIIKTFESNVRRRVISKKTSMLLRHFCRDVVEEGTGKSAAVENLDVCGKTGTAQKADNVRGYSDDAYVASFVGFMPFEDPRITCLVLLDEPGYDQRFGGVSAAPVFANICKSLINATTLFEDVLVSDVLKVEEFKADQVCAPNFLGMDVKDARARARAVGITVLSGSEEGQVVAQNPDPGVRMEKDRIIRLGVSHGESRRGETVPDLRGLPLREAKRRIVRNGWKCSIKGSGIVVSQIPRPGRCVAGGIVKLSCK